MRGASVHRWQALVDTLFQWLVDDNNVLGERVNPRLPMVEPQRKHYLLQSASPTSLQARILSTYNAGMQPDGYYSQTTLRSSDWSDRTAEPGFAPVRVIIEAAKPHLRLGGRVLDVGCQGGHQLALLSEDFDELVGIDIASYDAMWAQFNALNFLVHDVDKGPLPFPDGHFRTVIATNVLEHVFDVFGLVRELSRVLEIRGTCLLAVPNVSCWRHVVALVNGRVPRTGANEYPFEETQGWDGQHLHYFTHSELTWLLGRFDIIPIANLVLGRAATIKRLAPRYLCGGIVIVGCKVR